MKKALKIMIVGLLAGLAFPAWGQQFPKKEDYTLAMYEFPDSLFPPYDVNIVGWDTDSQGNVWLAVRVWDNDQYCSTKWGGLVKFDGTNWTLYPYGSGDYVARDKCPEHIVIDRYNNKWIITDQYGGEMRVVRFKDGVFTTVFRLNAIDDFSIDKEDRLWIGYYTPDFEDSCLNTNILEYDFSGNKLNEFYFPTAQLYIEAVDQQNRKWFGGDHGLFIYDDKAWTNYTFEDIGIENIEADSNEVGYVIFDSQGNAWVRLSGIGTRFVKMSPDGSKKLVRMKESLGGLGIEKVDGKDYFWSVDTYEALVKESLSDSAKTIYFPYDEFSGVDSTMHRFNLGWSIKIDSQGRKWMLCSWDNPDKTSINAYKKGLAVVSKSPITGVEDNNNSVLPNSCILFQNYPNPFNSATTIRYSLNRPGRVTLVVYDSRGRLVKRLVSEYQQSGNHQARFNASSLPSGIYFYRLEANGFSQVKKMLLVK